ncbi:MAG TPA: hypothetical protein VGD90_02250 [Sphingobacteriaceae bacterium]
MLLITTASAFSVSGHLERVFNDYAKDELQYFEEVAFRDDRLYRWRRPIVITQEGANNKSAAPVLERMINEVQPLLGDLSISLQSGRGNLIIHHPAIVADYARRYSEAGPLPLGYAIPQLLGSEITHVDIYLHPLLLPEKREEVLKHEICHALGLLQHTSTPYPEYNLLGIPASLPQVKDKTSHPYFSRLDKAALRLLYDKRLRPNFSKRDFLRKTAL